MYGEDGMDTLKMPFLNSKHIAFLDANRHVIEDEEVDEKLQNDYDIERQILKHKKSVGVELQQFPVQIKTSLHFTRSNRGRKNMETDRHAVATFHSSLVIKRPMK